jgi:phthalate 4,5-dioxygenase oxygenase subunit
MWETMGPIADRAQERLGVSDTAILQFRRIMVEAAHDFVATGRVIGRGKPYIPHAKLRSFEGVVPKTEDWRTLGVSPEERALVPVSEAAE